MSMYECTSEIFIALRHKRSSDDENIDRTQTLDLTDEH